MSDITLADHGSLCILTPRTDAARDWFAEHVGDDDTQFWGADGYVVEPRYVEAILDGAEDAGFTIGEG